MARPGHRRPCLGWFLLILGMLLTPQPVRAAADPYRDRQDWIDRLGATVAWEAGLDGSGIIVAVIDSGLAANHEDLAEDHLLPGRNYTGIGSAYSTTDRTGHGTFICGLLAAQQHNGLGILGLVDGVSLLPLKCFDPNTTSSVEMVAEAIADAAEAGSDVISMSFGLPDPAPVLEEAIAEAAARGIILVAAVGDGSKEKPVYPALYDDVIGVGALAADGSAAVFSSADASVFVTAPGEGLVSLWHTAPDDYKANGYGTSYAAAFVTAMAAMARQYSPAITAEQFKALLAHSATDLGEPGYDTTYGYGSVHVAAFVEQLQKTGGDFQHLDLSILAAAEQAVSRPTDIKNNAWHLAAIAGCLALVVVIRLLIRRRRNRRG